ncbi:MAG TPA: carbohydrate-binding protein [Cellvibrio sp.]|nr:carbohydrate-binding protein [Cellvibrio sp.]
MATQTTNRLGDILISKGLITPEQLTIAINEQKKRRQQLAPLDAAQAAPLGEILIELGFINRMQLKRGLGWQSVVRKVTLAMSLCAPLLTISYEAAAAPVAVVSSSSSSKSGSGNAIPLTIQAENYDSMVSVKKETTTDIGGGLNVGSIDTNDSMSFVNSSVVIPATGTYKIVYRVAAESAGSIFTLSEGTSVYDTVTVPGTGGWQNWVDVERTVTLTKGTHSFNIKAVKGGFNLNWFRIDNAGANLPQTIDAENYATMSGVKVEATTDIGGGMNVGSIDTQDSMSYTSNIINIPTTGTYQISYRVASESLGGQFNLIEADTATVYDTVTVPVTKGWQTWTTITRTVSLPAGQHKFALVATKGGFNVNWFKIENPSASSSSQTSTATTSKASSVASSTTVTTSSVKASSNSSTAPTASSVASSKPVVASSAATVTSSSAASSAASAQALPLTIKAENYSTMSGIKTEATTDTGGGNNIGAIDSSDWLNFAKTPVNIPKTGTYKISYRVASEYGGGAFILNEAGSSAPFDTVSVPSTGSWQAWTTIERTVTLTAGVHNFGITATSGGFNLNWIKIEEINTPLNQTIKAESYSTMSGITTEATSDTGGGNNVGAIDTGDWLNFAKTPVTIPKTGTYKVSYRVASEYGLGSFILNEAGSKDAYDTVSVPNTGGWQNWTTVEHTVNLTAGTHNFGITATTSGFNLNWIKFEEVSAPLNKTIEAENYSTMGGVKTETTTDTGGGLNVGAIDSGDWMSYSGTSVEVSAAGSYKITYRVASESGGGKFSLVESSTGAVYDTVSVASTGGWQNWVLIERVITLSKGTHSFDIKAATGGFNMNWFKISSLDSSTSVSSSSSSAANSSTATAISKSSVSSSSVPATVSSSSKASLSSSSASTTTNNNGVITTKVAGPVGMSWIAPNMRQNGSVLDITEIAGYEIRYKLASANTFTYISVNDAWTNTYNFPWLEGNYVFQIAAFDKDGLYSDFVDVVSK